MKIFAVDTNYLQHNKTLSSSFSKPEAPVIFTKCDTALLKDGKPFFIPDMLGNIEYETELVVRIGKLGKTIPTRFASRYYDAVTVGVDFTARDLQKRLQEQGLPWELSKGFDGAAALGTFVPLDKAMLFKVDEIISYISQYFTLRTGDLLYTGCPTGCAPVRINDHLEGYIEEQKVLEFNCK